MLTIVIPVRNRRELVLRTLRSVRAQTLRPLSLIVVDNASTDGTLEAVNAWAASFSEPELDIRVISETEPGAATARNCGLRQVTTPYVMFFDSDDVMPAGHCQSVIDAIMAHNQPDILFWRVRIHPISGKSWIPRFVTSDLLFNHMFHSILSTQRFAVRTELIKAVGGWNDKMTGWDDYELGVRLLLKATSAIPCPDIKPVEVYSQAESLTGTNFSHAPEKWEHAIDECERVLTATGITQAKPWCNMRRAILAGHYSREGAADYASRLMQQVLSLTAKHKLLYRFTHRYVVCGGRGSAFLAKLFIR